MRSASATLSGVHILNHPFRVPVYVLTFLLDQPSYRWPMAPHLREYF
jgi:hypothetical protein